MEADKRAGLISTSGAFLVGVLVACAPVHANRPDPAASLLALR
jgi:hypothetical protein